MTYRYRAEILEALAEHGLRPALSTAPRVLRDAINDLYRYEIRILRDRCRARAFPVSELSARVIDLRRRYLLLSMPMEQWLEAAGGAGRATAE